MKMNKSDLQYLCANGGLVVEGTETNAELIEAITNLVGKRSGGRYAK
jgi:hypothetical protein